VQGRLSTADGITKSLGMGIKTRCAKRSAY
jgi:hypothetical protein